MDSDDLTRDFPRETSARPRATAALFATTLAASMVSMIASAACEKPATTATTPPTEGGQDRPRAAPPAGIYFPNLGQKSAGALIADKYLQWRSSFVHDVDVDGKTYTIVAMGPKDGPQDFEDGEGPRVRWDVTTSEAIGYGLFALADAALDGRGDGQERALFDKMWRFALANPSPASEPIAGVSLMAWLWDPAGKNYTKWKSDPAAEKRFLGNASDGDIWMAAGLIRAHQAWGSTGELDYQSQAKSLLTLIQNHNVGPNSKLITLGDWVDPSKPIQASSPNCQVTDQTPGEYVTRTSDFTWMFFQEFYDFTQDENWLKVIDATQSAVIAAQDATPTKLVPDVLLVQGDSALGAQFDVFCDATESGLHKFGWNAVRAPTWWMWHAIDTHGTKRGELTLKILRDMSEWMVRQGIDSPDDIGYEYDLATGKPKAKDYYPTIFITGFNAAMMAEPTEPKDSAAARTAVDSLFLYLSRVNLNEWYFDHTVLLLGLEPLTGDLSASR